LGNLSGGQRLAAVDVRLVRVLTNALLRKFLHPTSVLRRAIQGFSGRDFSCLVQVDA
jgi:hypothetical protein